MFERLTERSRNVLVAAQEEAVFLNHGYIGTEHILLGLLRDEDAVAARALHASDVTLEAARAEVVRIVGVGTDAVGGEVPFTPRSRR
jgi:ATP-dependent Clp protease ATP-binding subunit ClpC